MKNLDTSLSNQSILDESFSNFTAEDVNSLRQQLQVATDRLNELKNKHVIGLAAPIHIAQLDSAKRTVVELQKKLDAIPKSIIDAVDKINQSSSQLALKGNTNNLPVNQDNKTEQSKTNFFTTKNIVIGISVLALAVGGFFLVKKIIKK